MKIVLAIFLAATTLATLVNSKPLPQYRSLHNMCSQNMVCADHLVCRRDNEAAYGTCEIPTAQITA